MGPVRRGLIPGLPPDPARAEVCAKPLFIRNGTPVAAWQELTVFRLSSYGRAPLVAALLALLLRRRGLLAALAVLPALVLAIGVLFDAPIRAAAQAEACLALLSAVLLWRAKA